MPFLVQVPGTLGWDSSTSKEAVSLSVVFMSVSSLLIVIFRAVKKIVQLCQMKWKRNTQQQTVKPHSAVGAFCVSTFQYIESLHKGYVSNDSSGKHFHSTFNTEQTWCRFSVTE